RETKLIPELMSDSFRDTFFLTTELEKLERQLRDIDRFTKSGFLGSIPILGAYSPEELKAMREELEETVRLLTRGSGGPSTRGRARNAPFELRPSEEFLQIEARLREQIELFVKTGQAAKVAYQIQSGQLDEL